MTRRRNNWGSVRQLASGRFQARYRVAGVEYLAPRTFRTKWDAQAFLATARADLERGTWIDPDAGKVRLAEYARRWLDERPQLRPRTRELYEAQLRRHILPTFGPIALRDLRRHAIRTWYAGLLNGPRPGASTAAKCYRLLRSILATAVEDELIPKNPVAIKGAGVEHPKERPIASIEQVYALAEAIEPRYRAWVLTATFTGLRLGELRALTRRRLDLLHATVHVTEADPGAQGRHARRRTSQDRGRRSPGRNPQGPHPRTRGAPRPLGGPGPDGLVFCGTRDQPMRRASLYTACRRAVRAADVEGLRFQRSATYRQHIGRGHRRQHQGTHDAHGARVTESRFDLPARN